MAVSKKNYVDLTGLSRFLADLQTKLAANSSNSFTVNYATYADKAQGDTTSISSTYVKKATTIAGVNLQDSITKDELLSALGNDVEGAMEAGAQVNVLEGVSFKGSGASDFADLTITNKKAILDLSGYALKSEIAAALNFKGAETGARLAAATTTGAGDTLKVAKGDVYTCTSDSGNFHSGYEYAASVEGTTITWTELGKWIDQSLFVQKTQKVNGKDFQAGDITLNGADIALTGYTKASADAAVAATDTINAAVGKLEYKVDANKSAIGVLNGNDTTAGSVAKSIKDAIAGLNVTAVSGDYITAVGEVEGKVTVTPGTKGSVVSGSTGLVDGGAVYTAVEGAKSASAVTLTSSSVSGSSHTGEGTFTFKQGDASAVTINVAADLNRLEKVQVKGIGDASATDLTIDANKATLIDFNSYFGSVSNGEIDTIFGITG